MPARHALPLTEKLGPLPQHLPDRPIIPTEPFGNVGALFPPPERVPLPDQADHFPAHSHQLNRRFRAIQVTVDLVPDGTLGFEHFGS